MMEGKLTSLLWFSCFTFICFGLATALPKNGHKHIKTEYFPIPQVYESARITSGATAPRRRASEEQSGSDSCDGIEMPIFSGSDFGGDKTYYTTIQVGTPPQKLTLVVDIGGHSTWMNCEHGCKGGNCGANDKTLFLADRSSSFKPIPCSTELCSIELNTNGFCPTSETPCAYDTSYEDGSSVQGFFAYETATLSLTDGNTTTLKDIVVGCSAPSDSFTSPGADGVLGLANGPNTFVTIAASQFGPKFSYCLVDIFSPKNVSSYLIVGGKKRKSSLLGKIQRTKLAFDPSRRYGVYVKGISVDGVKLDIPSSVWNVEEGQGLFLDSGATLTMLAQEAYRPIMDAFERSSLSKFERITLKEDPDTPPFEFCFNSTGFNESWAPKLVFHLKGGAEFEPLSKGYIIELDTGVKCVALMSGTTRTGASILGNLLQQNHFWEFDLEKEKLGFARSTCT